MREIKFRMWDNDNNCFTSIDLTDIDNTIIELAGFRKYFSSAYFKERSEFIMQFTGMKDKNGKDIYEGDIVKWETHYFDADAADIDDWKKVWKTSFVEYSGHGFWVNEENFGWEGEGLWNWEQMEVIGNIYENKNLLSNEQSNKIFP